MPQNLWGLWRNYWSVEVSLLHFPRSEVNPFSMMWQKLSKLVRVNQGWFSCLVRKNTRETREKVESILQCTDDANWGLVTFSTSFLAFQGRTNIIWCFKPPLVKIWTSLHLVYWCCRYFKLKREHLPPINLVQGCANSFWCLKASGASGVHQKGSLCGSWCTPKAVQRVRIPGAKLRQWPV